MVSLGRIPMGQLVEHRARAHAETNFDTLSL